MIREKNLLSKIDGSEVTEIFIGDSKLCPYMGDVDCSGADLHGECSTLSHYSCETYQSKNIRRSI
jgi:hypothetical protein